MRGGVRKEIREIREKGNGDSGGRKGGLTKKKKNSVYKRGWAH